MNLLGLNKVQSCPFKSTAIFALFSGSIDSQRAGAHPSDPKCLCQVYTLPHGLKCLRCQMWHPMVLRTSQMPKWRPQDYVSTSRAPFGTGPKESHWRKRGWWKKEWFFHSLIGKLPQSILWTPLCLCPCAKQSRLPRLARSLAKYWRLPVETQPVKTVWEEKALDESWAKNTTGRGGGIQTHPNLPTGPVEERMDRTSKGRGESRPHNPREKERQNNKGLGVVGNEWWNITHLHELCVENAFVSLWSFYCFIMNVMWSE